MGAIRKAKQGRTDSNQAERDADRPADAVGRLVADQLAELARLRGVGMELVGALSRQAAGALSEREAEAVGIKGDIGLVFPRIARAVRQIMAMEQEIVGLRPMRAAERPVDMAAVAEARRAAAARAERADGDKEGFDVVGEDVGAPVDRMDVEDIANDLYDLVDDYDADEKYDLGKYAEVVRRIRTVFGARADAVGNGGGDLAVRDDADSRADDSDPFDTEALGLNSGGVLLAPRGRGPP